MTSASSTTGATWAAIDIAKLAHQVLVEAPDGRRRTMRVANSASEIERLVTYLQALQPPCVIAFEPTGDYHRAVMHRLGQAGFALRQVSSLAVARTRDALYNSWDKNDPKDAQVILHLLKTGTTQRFVDPPRLEGITTCRNWPTRTNRCRCARCGSSTRSGRTISPLYFPNGISTVPGPRGSPMSCG